MSTRLMVQAMSARVGSPARKIVLIKLADNANDNGECWPSLQHIADDCEITKRAVRNQINALIDMGLVSKRSRYHDNRQCSNGYLLTLNEPPHMGRNDIPPGGNEVPGEGERGSSPGGNEVPPEEPVIGTCHKNQERKVGKQDDQSALWSPKPSCIPDELWSDWIEHRRLIKKPFTELAAKQLATKLEAIESSGHKAEAAMRESIINGWQGVFPPKDKPAEKIKKRKEL